MWCYAILCSYEVMRNCWAHIPVDRPSFNELSTILEVMLPTEQDASTDVRTLSPYYSRHY